MRQGDRPFQGAIWSIDGLSYDQIMKMDPVLSWKSKWNNDPYSKMNIMSREVVSIQIEPCHNVDIERVVKLNTTYKYAANRDASTVTENMFIKHNTKELQRYYDGL